MGVDGLSLIDTGKYADSGEEVPGKD